MQETDRQMQETDRRMQETDRRMQETDRLLHTTDMQIKELGKQIAGLGRKFGCFAEGMAMPSMIRMLREEFKMDHIFTRARVYKNGSEREIDVLAYSNGATKAVYVVEIKSLLREDGIRQTLDLLDQFFDYYPEHRDKKLYGIIAVVDAPQQLRQRVMKLGLYLAEINDETFELKVTPDFKPRCFQAF